MTETRPQQLLRYTLATDFDQCLFDKLLARKFDSIEISTHQQRRTYLDTFDWRVYRSDLLCSHQQNKPQNLIRLEKKDDESLIASAPCPALPHFANDLMHGVLSQRLKPITSIRALLPLITLDCQLHSFNIRNKSDKITFTITIMHCQPDKPAVEPATPSAQSPINLLYVRSVKGYPLPIETLTAFLEKKFKLKPQKQNLLQQLTPWLAYAPGSHSDSFKPKLDKQQAAQLAAKLIYGELLDTIELNENGIRQDLDSEFLHDFRVAIRRTRSGLKYIEQVLPRPRVRRFTDEFDWLAGNTGRLRDLDVLLLKFDQYKLMLPEKHRSQIEPLRTVVKQQRELALKTVISALNNQRYETLKQEWRNYLLQDIVTDPSCPLAREPIINVAREDIWRSFQRIIKRGSKIDADSPAEYYHRLRKNCKQLRYLVEFFQSLFPTKEIKQIRNDLTAIQDLLGEFQDLCVQIAELHAYAKGQDDLALPPQTLLAIGALIEKFEQRKLEIRSNYEAVFHEFASKQNTKRFKTLFQP